MQFDIYIYYFYSNRKTSTSVSSGMAKTKDTQFRKDLLDLGVDDSCIDAVMEIHHCNPDLVPYECKRQYNIMQNEEKLRSLNLIDIKSVMKPPKPTQSLKRKMWTPKPKSEIPLEPSRKSARIAGKPINYNVSDYVPEPRYTPVSRPRVSKPKLKFEDIVDVQSDSAVPILDVLKEKTDLLDSIDGPQIKQEFSVLEDIEHLYLDENYIAKMCKNRISSMSIHPGNKVIVAAGSKKGEVGLFMPGEKKVTLRLEPHVDLVGGCQFSWSKLFTSSYDSTVRMFDAETLQYNEIFSKSSDMAFRSLCLCSENELLVAGTSGKVFKLDIRENKKVCSYPAKSDSSEYGSLWALHHNKFDTNYFLSTSNNASIAVWDYRNTKHPTDVSSSHCKTVSSAIFDPVRGKKVLSVGYDDKVCISDFSDKGKLTEVKKISHCNNTGRWLTKFRAQWHPSSDELFVIGSMAQPRRIEIYNVNGQMERTLSDENHIGSIQSLVEFHPTQNALVCCNGSGYCYIFHGD